MSNLSDKIVWILVICLSSFAEAKATTNLCVETSPAFDPWPLGLGILARCTCGGFSRERLRRVLRKKAAVVIHLHTFATADLHLSHLHICWSTSSHLHICWSTSSHPHICWSTSSHPHICRSTSSHPHTCWSTSLHLHACRSTSSHPHICWSTSSHPHTCRSTSSHPHICRSTSSHLHICRSPLALLSISLLRQGRCCRSAMKRNPFARNGRWTSKTEVKLRF